MANPLLTPEVRSMLASQDTASLTAVVNELHAASVAELAEDLSVEDFWQLLNHASVERQAEIFSFVPLDIQETLVEGLGHERVSRLLEAMSHDDRVDLLRRLEPEIVESLLPLVARADREDIRRLLSYPEDSAGAWMTTDYAALPAEITVHQALEQLRHEAPQRETIYYVYVVDDQRQLIGFVSLQDLILARPQSTVQSIMRTDVVSVGVTEDQEHLARRMADYDFLAIPVVDEHNRLVGIVTHDDVADVIEEEATEDFHLSSAIAPLTERYSVSSIAALYRRRIGWLLVLIFVNLVSSGVIAAYEETLQATIALAFFLPLLIDSGGNTGSQAATLIIRAMATQEVRMRQWMWVLLKEMGVGLALGLTMALASLLLGIYRAGLEVGLIVGLSMLLIVLATNLLGVILPFILTRLRMDPAVASSPLITTVADALGLLLYFTIATWIMSFGNG